MQNTKTWRDRLRPGEMAASFKAIAWGWRQTETRHKLQILSLALCRAVTAGIGVYNAMIFRSMINSAAGRNTEAFRSSVLLLVAVTLCSLALSVYQRYMSVSVSTAVTCAFQEKTFSTLLRKEYGMISQKHTGVWTHRFYQDVGEIANGVCSLPPQIASILVTAVGSGYLLLRLIPAAALLVFPLLAVLTLAIVWTGVRLRKLGRAAIEKNEHVYVRLLEHLSSLLILHAYEREEASEKGMAQTLAQRRQKDLEKAHFSTRLNTVISAGMQTVYVGGAIICAAYILGGQLEYGTFAAILQLVSMLQGQAYATAGLLPHAYAVLLSSERMLELEAYPNDYAVPPLQAEKTQQYYRQSMTALGLEHVAFRYPGEEKRSVLTDLSLEVKKGEFVAITGPSGCGKSTVLKLLLALYHPEKGTRYLAEAGNRICLDASWRTLFAYVPQQNLLLTGTVREAVTFLPDKDAKTEANCWRALDMACAGDFVRTLPEGLDTVLGEKGSGLSEGQMQRLAIARAICSKRPVLLLDECTSALDEDTETRVLQNLRALSDRTVLIVTHRPAALEICDREYRFPAMDA